MPFLPLDLLRSGAEELGIPLDDEQLRLMDEFAELLVEANRSLNLTRITEPREIVINHYLDSLTCLAAVEFPKDARVIDIGTGAGFPGVPIAIARPDLWLTLMDSTKKKLDFIARSVEQLGVTNVELVHARAEEAGRDPAHREHYDIALARALADMRILAELCLPLVRVGGRLIAQKSGAVDGELTTAKPIIGQLGGKVEKVASVTLPNSDVERSLIVIGKAKGTSRQFPRSYAALARRSSTGDA